MKRICSLLLALAILLSLCACKKLPESSESILYAMDTQMDFRLYGDDDGVQSKRTELASMIQDIPADLLDDAIAALQDITKGDTE